MGSIFSRSFGDYSILTATIAASAATSDVIDIGNHITSFAVCMPSSWTAASLAFQSSPTIDGTYNPVVGATGAELTCSATVDVMISLMETIGHELMSFRFIKVISGTSASPVVQDEERELLIMVK